MTRSVAFSLIVSMWLSGVAHAAGDSAYSTPTSHEFPRAVYWGDTHLHTSNSFDAFSRGGRLTAVDAYRFARGEQVSSNTGQPVRLARPLDFLVIADHGEAIGTMQAIADDDPALTSDPVIRRWRDMLRAGQAYEASSEIIKAAAAGELPPPMLDPEIVVPLTRSIWGRYVSTADSYYEPGKFTALIGYEWSSTPDGDNLHRVVVFRDGSEKTGQILPFSYLDSPDPEDLWRFLAGYEEKTGGQALAIPHNSNLSNGRMFAPVDFRGNLITADYAERRSRWEPIVEATQIKGDSESHPVLSPNDEFAAFGDYGWDRGNLNLIRRKARWMYRYEYLRSALTFGLAIADRVGENPYKFGMIGSTDSHTGLSAVEEDNYFGKFGVDEPGPDRTLRIAHENGPVKSIVWNQESGGYAAVWAHENTRESIFDAMRRKEVYATTGPRLTVRFFGGWHFEKNDAVHPDIAATGYRKGVPMGADLPRREENGAPVFLVAALRDPLGANLDRIQIVKGWLDIDGQTREKIYDVAWGDAPARSTDADGRLTPVGSTVDPVAATWTNAIGDPELITVWTDPDFDSSRAAFYYARVLEIPTPRWTAYDAKAFDLDLPDDVIMTHQERAYTSPIWYTP